MVATIVGGWWCATADRPEWPGMRRTTVKIPTMAVDGGDGRPWFAVRYLSAGARYGRANSLIVDRDTVEFWDLSQADDAAPGELFGPLGQFVSRYYVHEWIGEDKWSKRRELRAHGLCLDGGNRDVWSIDGDGMAVVLKWMATVNDAVKAGA